VWHNRPFRKKNLAKFGYTDMPHLVYVPAPSHGQSSVNFDIVETIDSCIEAIMETSLSTIDEEGVEAPTRSEVQFEAMNIDNENSQDNSTNEIDDGEGFEAVFEAPPPSDAESSLCFFDDESLEDIDTAAESPQRRHRRKAWGDLMVWSLVVIGVIVFVVGVNKSAKKNELTASKSIGTENSFQSVATGDNASLGTEDSDTPSSQEGDPGGAGDNTGNGDDAGNANPVPPPSPSAVPFSSPSTSSPISSPAQCVEEVSTNKSCYSIVNRDVIDVTFRQCDPRSDDWVGFYPAGSDGLFLSEGYFAWSWTCGASACSEGTTAGALELLNEEILPGFYQAFLVIDSPYGAPYHSVASSAVFTIAWTCPPI
jgi:hypothetical protein